MKTQTFKLRLFILNYVPHAIKQKYLIIIDHKLPLVFSYLAIMKLTIKSCSWPPEQTR